MARKLSPLERVQADITEKFGAGAVVRLSDGPSFASRSVIPTGLRALDNYVIGKPGGIPPVVVEVYSPEGLGKTALGMMVTAQCQKRGGVAVWADAEQTFDPERAVYPFGVDADELLMIEPTDAKGGVKSGEVIGAEIETALKALVGSPGPNIMVIDSIDAIQPEDVLKKGLEGEERIGAKGKLTSRLARTLNALRARAGATIFLINQLRDKIGVMFGETTTTPGGNAIKFYASLRLKLSGGKRIEEGGREIGKYIRIKAVKNKLDVPSREIEARFLYETGWDDAWTTLNLAKDLDLVPKSAKVEDDGAVEEATAALDGVNWGRGGAEPAPEAAAEEPEPEPEAAPAKRRRRR